VLVPASAFCYRIFMIWLFDREGERLSYEICRNEKGTGYLLVLTATDGQKQVEHVNQPSELIERSIDQLRQLREAGWKVG
jgi:hypothetical protein